MSEGEDAKAETEAEAEIPDEEPGKKPEETPGEEPDEGAEGEAGEGEGDASEEGDEEAPQSLKDKLLGKILGKILAHMKLIVIGAGALVLVGGGAGLYVSGILTPEKPHEITVELPGPPVYYELQRITVDLKPTKKRARPFIRLGMQVELQGQSAKDAFITNEIKIMDAFQAHLRTVTPDELSGEQGTERLRQDFITIVNRIIAPERAVTVLYKDILVR